MTNDVVRSRVLGPKKRDSRRPSQSQSPTLARPGVAYAWREDPTSSTIPQSRPRVEEKTGWSVDDVPQRDDKLDEATRQSGL